jgi:sugar phosphate permease
MLALGVTCLMTSLLSGEAQIMQLSFMMFLLNLFSAVQDIAVDSLAVSILDPHELGAGNTVQVVAYKAGSMFAGGLLLYMREAYGWSPMFLTFASIYFICIALTSQLNLVDADGVRQKQKSDDQNADKEHLSQIFNVKGTLWLVSFVLFYKLCERSEQTFALFLVDKKVPREELALLSTFIRAFSIIGSTASGIALTRGTSAQRLVIQFAVLRAITIFGLTIVLSNWGLEPATFDTTKRDYYFKFAGFSLICLTSISAGAVTTATFTLMMRLSQTAPDKIRGTHYSLLATSEVLGKLMFAALAGWLLDIAGLPIMFVVFTLLAFLVIPFIQSAPPSVINIKSGHQ